MSDSMKAVAQDEAARGCPYGPPGADYWHKGYDAGLRGGAQCPYMPGCYAAERWTEGRDAARARAGAT